MLYCVLSVGFVGVVGCWLLVCVGVVKELLELSMLYVVMLAFVLIRQSLPYPPRAQIRKKQTTWQQKH